MSSYSRSRGKYFVEDVVRSSSKRVCHIFRCRLKRDTKFRVSSAAALVGAGYASFAMGLITLFRPVPVLVYVITCHLKSVIPQTSFNSVVVISVLFVWSGLMLFVLFFLGAFLAASEKIKKRWVLMLHPWGLLILYFDVFVWSMLTAYIHYETSTLQNVDHFLVYFIVMYAQILILCLIQYMFATFFIIAELTIIENYF